jgi:hypothetical protein
VALHLTERQKIMTTQTRSFLNKTTSFLMGKKPFQNLRRDFKKQGFTIDMADNGMYELRDKKTDKLLLCAANGYNGYLIRCVENLFSVNEK